MSVNVDLTKRQYNKLMKGEKVRLKNSQLGNGDYKLQLDNNEFSRFKRNMKSGKGFQIDHGNLSGSGLKDIFKKAVKTTKKIVKVAKPIVKQVGKELKPIAKQVGRELLKTNRKFVDMGLENIKQRSEAEIEGILEPYLGKDLSREIVNTNSDMLSSKANKMLNKMEGDVHKIMKHPEVNLRKGIDYDVLNPYNINPDGLNDLPVAVATEIKNVDGSGLNMRKRVVYLKGKGIKGFFKKLGRTFGKIIKSPIMKKVFGELAKTGVSSLTTAITGSPVMGEVTKNLTGSLVEKGVDKLANSTGEAMGGGILTSSRTTIKKGGSLIVPGGALYVPGSSMRGRGINSGDTYNKSQGGKYLLVA